MVWALASTSRYPEEPVKWIRVLETEPPCSVGTNQVDARPQILWASPCWFPINLTGAEGSAGGFREAETHTRDYPGF